MYMSLKNVGFFKGYMENVMSTCFKDFLDFRGDIDPCPYVIQGFLGGDVQVSAKVVVRFVPRWSSED